MATGLYVDVHVPASITSALRRRGVDVLTSQEDGTTEADDSCLLERATALQRVLFTQDTDFLRIAAEWQANRKSFCSVIFARQVGPGIGEVVDELELFVQAAAENELWNMVFHLPMQ